MAKFDGRSSGLQWRRRKDGVCMGVSLASDLSIVCAEQVRLTMLVANPTDSSRHICAASAPSTF